jgi:rhodanese-related sulfurtransferase
VDLLGQRLAPFLARWLHHTIHEKLLKLPNEVAVYPTHGGGSFCSAGPHSGGGIPSSIARERQQNPFVERSDEADFVQFALTGLGSYPAYYKYMADINRRGPDVLGGVPRLASLTPLSAMHQINEGAILVDARSQNRFNEAHVTGSLSVPYSDNFSTWVGWIVPWHTPLIFVSSGDATSDGIVRQLIRIGYDRLNGHIAGDPEDWTTAGLFTESTPVTNVEGLRESQRQVAEGFIVDVRQHNEFRVGHVKGALNIELGELTQHLDGLPRDMPLAVLCASGMRATIAGSILQRDGRKNIQVLAESGTDEWLARGFPSATGEE